jgi:UPF0716 protein FxsA
MRLAWLFLGWMLIEIGLFVTLGGRIGVFATWAEVLGNGVGGVLLIRHQKRRVMGQVMNDLRSLGGAVTPAAHSALIVLAGVLLILPGFLTDAMGLILLIPWVRDFIIEKLRHRVRMAATDAAVNAMLNPRPRHDDIVEATVVDTSEAPSPGRKPSGWTKP